ncbi:PD-(D/E)XK nuclease family protein [Microbulbifer sp. CAU 1566]|uniref:PD-(D/E)XK nuclease family protein n=1 Tax=Microbulbifer sp. CAU 1566 TaxID=2933269 RepID=UPI002003AF6E|nr:PD-(D/E)XK nuclease family protein [Microbulbifer sp. CAU 1566]MCK7596934.1 PD-(D/E)XK nuclease family protein [Microbulbifer sp. CAU 1566]
MLQPAFPVLEILAQLPPGGLLLTPNNRLRNRCQQVYASEQPAASSWTPPAVESMQGWLDKLWFTLQQQGWAPAMQQVLNREQRQLLWQRAFDEALEKELLNSLQLCRDADGALAQLLQWQLVNDLEQLDSAIEPLLEQFALSLSADEFPLFRMIRAFADQLRQHNAITPDQRDQRILQAFSEGVLPKLPQIDTAGFAQISPLYQSIIESAAENVIDHLATKRQAQISRAPCTNLEEELYQAARWATQKLEASKANNSRASVGIVVNNLGQCRAQVESIFARVLEPQFLDPAQQRYTLPFNFSAGTPLAQTPIGAAALQLLELLADEWDYSQLRNLLFSPFWGNEQELWLRSALFRRLQKLELRRVTGDTLRYWAERITEELKLDTAQLPRQLEQIGDRQRRWQRAPAEVWAARFSEILATLGWPGQRNPDSQEYQQLLHWESALENFATLSAFAGSLSASQALQQLRQIASRTPFQAETRDGPLQILGVLEAGGLAFDHLRLVGFGQQQWPTAPSPNPLLPIQWQKHWKMPRASAERELELARELTDDLLNASGDIVVSYACEEDGVHQGLSNLFGERQKSEVFSSDGLTEHNQQLANAIALEKVADTRLPPLLPIECERVRGGASVLKAQALCPLNAQLRYRLGASGFMAPSIGLSPAERGNVVHQVLAEFWQACRDSTHLNALSEDERNKQIQTAIDNALRDVRKKHGHLPAGFWAMEQQRLLRLMDQWLELESQRPAFTVEKIEWDQQVTIGGLQFNLRLDRLDLLAGSEQLVIDYKTGTPSINEWLQDRIREPQLPLYALFQPEARAIAFGQVRTSDCKWSGCGELDQPINGIKAVADTQKDAPYTTWQDLSDYWQQGLELLAGEYRGGVASLQFDRPQDNTNQSELWPLNRWPERNMAEQAAQ